MSLASLYAPREAARYLGLAVQTLANRRHRGLGPRYIKLADGQVRYTADALRAFAQDGSQ